MFLCAASQRHYLRYDLVLFPTLTGTGTIFSLLRQSHSFCGPFWWQTASAECKKGNTGQLALPPNEVLSQLQFCRANNALQLTAFSVRCAPASGSR
jgi:hypothetical protein